MSGTVKVELTREEVDFLQAFLRNAALPQALPGRAVMEAGSMIRSILDKLEAQKEEKNDARNRSRKR